MNPLNTLIWWKNIDPFSFQIDDDGHPFIELEYGDVKLQQLAIIISKNNDIKIVLILKLLIFVSNPMYVVIVKRYRPYWVLYSLIITFVWLHIYGNIYH